MTATFVHLHLHTEFSLVDGLIRIKPLVQAVAAAGMPAVAVTDMSNLFAAVKFYKAASAAGLKPLIGADLWLRREPHDPARLVLLCQDLTGYRNLTRLISRGYLEGQQQGRPLLERAWLDGATDGLIALSGGREGELGRALLLGHDEQARRWLDDWLTLFPDRFYLELQRTGRSDEAPYIDAAVDLAAAADVPVVASNDVCFLKRSEFEAHEARVCIQEGHTLADPRRPHRYSEQQYLRSPAEMAELFADLPEALANSVEIAIRCNLELPLGHSFLPEFPIPDDLSADVYLAGQARAGLERRLARLFDATAPDFAERRRPYDERLTLELAVITQMGFPGYFLIVADFIQWAREHGVPVGPGRGSGAGSLVAYSLGITDLDPLAYDLLFERFLNPERVSMPDFDIDFCMEGRDRVIEYVTQRYGRERVSQIATHGTMAAKAVVRDVGRVLGQPYGFVDRIAKLIPFELGMTLDKALAQDDEFRRAYQNEEEVRTLVDLAKSLEGLARSVGKHAGGVVIAPSVLTDFSPLYCEEGATALVTQYDKDDVEQVGLVKFDFLGLRTLTLIDWAMATINRQRATRGEPPLDITAIPMHDVATFKLLKECKTTAVFQLESRGMKDLVKRLQPDCFEDIVALVALFRPGPLQSGMVDDFVDRKHGRAPVVYPHPDLAKILAPTYGVILYQEQVMQIAQVLANYTLGGADILRRCLSGSTQIVDASSGGLVTLREIADNRHYWIGRQVFTLNLQTQRISRQPIVAVYPNGIRDVWEITTKTNRKIRATADHLFYTLLGWRPLAEFKSGDCIGLAKEKIVKSDVFWDKIVTIEYVGKEEVFDLTIPKHHNFIANYFIAHNCMGKKKPDEMANQRSVFTDGAAKRGVNTELANYVFDLIDKFSGYGFNKSHSAAYALISYQTAWLKAHYPAAFMAAVLSSDMDKTDKVVIFMEECRSMGLTVIPPSVNRSELHFTVDDDGRVIYGLGAVKGVGEAAVELLVEERRNNGPFRDVFDFCRRLDLRKVNRRVLESLIRAGAFDGLGANRATLMSQLPEAMRLAEQNSRADTAGQSDMFGLPVEAVQLATPATALADVSEWSEEELLKGEKETLGLYLTAHPISRYEAELRHFVTGRLADLAARSDSRNGRGSDQKVIIAGLVISVRTRNANRGGRMAFVTLDDRSARVEIRVFPEAYERARALLVEDNILVICGSLAWDDFSDSLRLTAEQVLDLDAARNEYARRLVLSVDARRFSNGLVEQLAATLAPYRQGNCTVWVDYQRAGARADIVFGPEWRVKPSTALLTDLQRLLGGGNVQVRYANGGESG
jgi:DNA polymerase-3 subunit alpha